MPTFDELRDGYAAQWKRMTILPSKVDAVNAIARRLLSHKARYVAVEEKTGVPWFLISALHERESSADFSTQLAQGDRLDEESTHRPAGRGPFSTWEEGAYDALVTLKHLDQIKDWSIPRICYEAERYNGFGYRTYHPSTPSPYLFSFSSEYHSGKYIEDGVWSSSTVDAQCGVLPIIKTLAQLDPSIKLDGVAPATAPAPSPAPAPQPEPSGRFTRPQFAQAIINAKRRKGYRVDMEPGQINIDYAEGWTRNADDTFEKNDDRPDFFNDLRCCTTFHNGAPMLLAAYQSTSRPGKYYTENRINSGGAANIWPGQYTAWQVGLHRGAYEALVQRGEIELTRDDNEDYKRDGDKHERGDYEGVNQHHASDAATIGPHSAGCLVGRFVKSHEEFMATVKSDPRYVADHSFMFTTAILERDDISTPADPRPPVVASPPPPKSPAPTPVPAAKANFSWLGWLAGLFKR